MVRNMNTTWIATSQITTARYFKYGGRWHKADDTAFFDGIWRVRAHTPGGRERQVHIYDDEVEAAPEGTIPHAFQPATLRRRARDLHDRAQQIMAEVQRLTDQEEDQLHEKEALNKLAAM